MYTSHITPKRRHSSLFDRMQNQIKKISKKLSSAKQTYRQSSSLQKNKNNAINTNGYNNNITATFFNQQPNQQHTQVRDKNHNYHRYQRQQYNNNNNNNNRLNNNNNQQFMRSINSIDEQTVIATARNNSDKTRYFNKNGRNKNYRAISAVTNGYSNQNGHHHNSTAPLRDLWENRIESNQNSTDNVVIKGLSTIPLKRKIYNNNNHMNNMKGQSFQLPATIKDQPSTMKILFKLQQQNSQLSFKLGRMSSVCQQKSYNVGKLRAELRETSRELKNTHDKYDKQNCYLITLLEHYKGKAEKYKKILRKNSQVSIDLESDSQ